MKKIDNFVNLYSVSKTLRFRAIPVGKTQENITIKRLLDEDEERAESYKKAKKIIDRYHKEFIDRVLSNTELIGLEEYVALYNASEKSENDKQKMTDYEKQLRSQIANSFKKDHEFKGLFDKSLIEEVLPKYLKDEEEKRIIKSFVGFKTAFEGFNQNRANMYSEEEKSTSIAYRCINDNLPRFISNMNCFEKIRKSLDEGVLRKIAEKQEIEPYSVEDLFRISFYSSVMSNKGIAFYNGVVGGFISKEGKKIQGLNEYINLYNQQLQKEDKKKRIPMLKVLFKQVLSEYEGKSFYAEGYKNVQELLSDLKSAAGCDSDIFRAADMSVKVFDELDNYNNDGIYIKNDASLTELSKAVTGDWSNFRDNWYKEYDKKNMKKSVKDMEKYEEKRKKTFGSIKSFSVKEIAKYLYTDENEYIPNDILETYHQRIEGQVEKIRDSFNSIRDIISEDYKEDRLKSEDVLKVKEYLDSIKELEKTLKTFMGTGKEYDRDEVFYGSYIKIWDDICTIDPLYNRIRNYVTSKPYSTDKYKLYFQNPQFMGGWDKNKVADYRATLLRKDGLYYVAIIDKSDSKVFDKLSESDDSNYYEVLDYKLIPGASKQLPHIFFSQKGIDTYTPSKEVIKAYSNGSFKKGSSSFSLDDCQNVIDYYKRALEKHEWNEIYGFRFSNTDQYQDISGFFKEVDEQGYKLSFYKINSKDIDALVESGKIYLFQIYNKDFSEKSHGMENLHTMFFKQVFNEENNGSIKLCGGAEFFFRKASIKEEDRVVHPANQELKNKNPLNKKKTSVFTYELIKDKRYTADQYEIHIPIQLNRVPVGMQRINDEVRKLLRDDKNPYIIGIDRGERNLLYICVIDGEGNIIEQESLNEIVNEYKGAKVKTDYHDLLARKEDERKKARQNWGSIENIKELKEGYISQVIHKICSLVIKYDAVIAMEDLNSGFKNSRIKVEKQVYQKFEKALIDKLNYLSDKSIEIGKNGSVTRAYQITNPFKSFKTMGTQNGFIFYIPAWLTSKIDPVTGFADLLKPKYRSIKETQAFIKSFDCIRYDATEEMFEFVVDYTKFDRTDADYKKQWKIYTNGTRIKTFRNPGKNNEWDNQEIILTDEFRKLFEKYGISNSNDDMRDSLCQQKEMPFYRDFMGLVRLMLQMRNSKTGTDIDYLISPVRNRDGKFYDSREADESLPKDADANGAYNIARKVLWAINQFRSVDSENISKTKIAISNKQWLEFVQN